MKKWEYLKVQVSRESNMVVAIDNVGATNTSGVIFTTTEGEDEIAATDELGADGWELVSTAVSEIEIIYFFKRVITDEK